MQTYSTPTSNGPSTGSESSSTTDQAKEKAGQAAGQAKEQAQQVAGQAKGAVHTQVDQRSTQAGERVGGLASDVRSVSETLREQGKDQPAKLAEQAADRAEKLGTYLKDSDSDRILGDIEDFGRRQPWAVIAGGVALGLVASRLLKASSSDRYQQRSSGQLPRRSSYDVSPAYNRPASGGPAVPTTPPADLTYTGEISGTPGATAPGASNLEGSR